MTTTKNRNGSYTVSTMTRTHWRLLAQHILKLNRQNPFTNHFMCNELSRRAVRGIPARVCDRMVGHIADHLDGRFMQGVNGFLACTLYDVNFTTSEVNEARVLFCLFMTLDTTNDTE